MGRNMEKTRDTGLESWLDELAAQSLPGGVSAAALASAMGAALLAKAARVTVGRQALEPGIRGRLDRIAAQARVERVGLVELAEADIKAYRAVLDAQQGATGSLQQHDAYLMAAEIPVRVAEVCHGLLGSAAAVRAVCWHSVLTDLDIGRWLLEAGMRAGLAAAGSNLNASGEGHGRNMLQRRIDALAQA
jgi:formiminotetrahydrofolate cyclodeaminase